MIFVKLLAFVALCFSVAWCYSAPGWEPGLSIVLTLSALTVLLLTRKKDTPVKQSQKVGKGSTAIQAGGDVSNINIHDERNVK